MCTPKKDWGLGFRDLKAFNKALLAKLGWRLQTNTHSLLHHVFKAQYFSDHDFLHAELGWKLSYAWRSIMFAQDVVRAGYRWRVGDDTSIQIWKDKWIPKPSTFQVISNQNTLPASVTISELINEVTREWKINLVKHVFLPDDAQAILSIPRTNKRTKYCMIWAHTPKGIFTVNSAYKVALSLVPSKTMEEASNTNNQGQFWRKIWSLNVPNKLKTFARRASVIFSLPSWTSTLAKF